MRVTVRAPVEDDMRMINRTCVALLVALFVAAQCQAQTDPLPSWNDGPTKQSIVSFIERATTEGGADYVPVAQRIATFDNDGTLWCEQPMYVQMRFALDRVIALAPEHPEWRTTQPFAAVLNGDLKALAAEGEKGTAELIMATHGGMSNETFEQIVTDWLKSARHPRFQEPYTACVYQPMLELLAYMRARGFQTHIVSGGGVEFMRPWTEQAYGIPPEQVVGSSIGMKYELIEERPTIFRLPKIDFVDDGPGKPVGIQKYIGRHPVAAFGNSDGDFEMLQWTTALSGARFGLIVHHTDAEREYAYDRHSSVGRLDRALDAAPCNGWVVVDMKRDWKIIFPFDK